MTGETPQPGGRQPAPGALALVQAFLNSHYDLEVEHGADLLRTPASLRHWLIRHELISPDAALGAGELERALAVREGLRQLAGPGERVAAPAELNRAAVGAAVELRFTATAPEYVAHAGASIDGALGVVLAAAARAMVDGTWSRLKVCPGENCGWAFFDHSRNQSGRWCSMAVCGGRQKAKAHYRRKRPAR